MTQQHARRTAVMAVSILVLGAITPWTTGAEPVLRGRPSGSSTSVARRLCETLHALPEARRAACCTTASNGSALAATCTRTLGAALARGAIVLAAADVERCAADSTRALDGCDWVTPQAPRLPASCRGIVHGRIAAGAACRSSLECLDGLVCWGASPAADGICAPPAASGASCGRNDDPLATSVRANGDERHPECAGFCRYGRCTARVAAGAACATSAQCSDGAHCAAGRCVEGPRPQHGEDCGATACADGLACIDRLCVAPRTAGESCTRPSDCAATCLPPGADGTRVCGMQCDAFPAALLRQQPGAKATTPPRPGSRG